MMFKFLKEKFSGWLGKKEGSKKDFAAIKKRVKKEAVKNVNKTKPIRKKFDDSTVKKEFKKEKADARADELGEVLEEREVLVAKKTEEILDKEKVEGEINEQKGFFGFLAKKLTTSELSAEDFDSAFEDFEMTLLENNVALGVVEKIKEVLFKELVGKKFGRKEVEDRILEALKRAIEGLLVEPFSLLEQINAKKDGPFVILFFGINGSGKTTSIAKLAWKLKQEGIDSVLAAGDTFRAASIEQLEMHANKIGVEVVKGDYGKDPASVAFDAISRARKERKKVVLIDTAGRMYTKQNLMREMEKIVKVSKPDLKIFVGESITGNDATEQAKMFNETAGIDGIILSKADVDEKAGTILSVSFVTGKPIYFLGVGQDYGDLQEFSKKNIFRNLGLED